MYLEIQGIYDWTSKSSFRLRWIYAAYWLPLTNCMTLKTKSIWSVHVILHSDCAVVQYKGIIQDLIHMLKALISLCMQEGERSDLLEQYRSLSMEAERYETQAHQLESEGSNLRLEVMTKDSEIRRLLERIDSMDRQIQQVRGHRGQGHSWWSALSNNVMSQHFRIICDSKVFIELWTRVRSCYTVKSRSFSITTCSK